MLDENEMGLWTVKYAENGAVVVGVRPQGSRGTGSAARVVCCRHDRCPGGRKTAWHSHPSYLPTAQQDIKLPTVKLRLRRSPPRHGAAAASRTRRPLSGPSQGLAPAFRRTLRWPSRVGKAGMSLVYSPFGRHYEVDMSGQTCVPPLPTRAGSMLGAAVDSIFRHSMGQTTWRPR